MTNPGGVNLQYYTTDGVSRLFDGKTSRQFIWTDKGMVGGTGVQVDIRLNPPC